MSLGWWLLMDMVLVEMHQELEAQESWNIGLLIT